MKKALFKLALPTVFLSLSLLRPAQTLAATAGNSCSTDGAKENCSFNPLGNEIRTGCCLCQYMGRGHQWTRISGSPCDYEGSGNAPATEGDITNPVLTDYGQGSGADIVARIIANVLKIAYSVAGLILLAMLIMGGVSWMTAGGDKEALSKAQKTLTSALVGFVVFASVFAIINFIAPALGLEFLQVLEIQWPTP